MNFQDKIRNFIGNATKPAVDFFAGAPIKSPIPQPQPVRQGGFINTLSNAINDNSGLFQQGRLTFSPQVNQTIRTVAQPINSYINRPFDALSQRSNEIVQAAGTGDYRQQLLNAFPRAAQIAGEELYGGLTGIRPFGKFVGGVTGSSAIAPVQLGVGLSQLPDPATRMQGVKNTGVGATRALLTAIGANRITP